MISFGFNVRKLVNWVKAYIKEIGLALGAYVLGVFVPILGYRSLYISTIGIIAVCIALYYGVHGRKAGRC